MVHRRLDVTMRTYPGGENHASDRAESDALMGASIDATGRSTATVTVLFCDLVGSTERQSRLGDEAADTFRRSMFEALADAVSSTGGEIVKNTGDGVMVVFRHSAVDAVTCSVRMHDLVEALDPERPAAIRVGIAAGEVASENGDWFGTPVVEAARLEGAAISGQTLVSAVVQSLVGSRGGHRFKSVGALALKGLPSPVPAAAVLRGPSAPEPPAVRSPRRRRRTAAAMVGVAVLIAAVVAASLIRDRRRRPRVPLAFLPQSGTPPPTRSGRARMTCKRRFRPRRAERSSCQRTARNPTTGTRCACSSLERRLEGRSPPSRSSTSAPTRWRAHRCVSTPRRSSCPSRAAPSEPVLTCPEYAAVAPAALARPIGDSRSISEGSAALAACQARLQAAGIDTDRYTYEDRGADVLDLLRALHLDEVHLVSGYVATVGALFVVREAPSAIRSLTLQGPIVPGESSYTDPTAHLAEAFDHYIQLCSEDESCAALGDLRAAYAEGHQSYASSPATVVGDDGDGGKHEVLLDGDRLAQVIANGLFDPDIHPLLASGIAMPRGELLDS